MKYYTTQNISLVSGSDMLDVETELGATSKRVEVTNDGPGDIGIQLSYNGMMYEPEIIKKAGEKYESTLCASKIKINYKGTATAYRLYAED